MKLNELFNKVFKEDINSIILRKKEEEIAQLTQQLRKKKNIEPIKLKRLNDKLRAVVKEIDKILPEECDINDKN